jgi:hypothetical protein
MKTVWEALDETVVDDRRRDDRRNLLGNGGGCRRNPVGRTVLDGLPAIQRHEARLTDREICTRRGLKDFMRRVGTTKREPASWKDMFFPEIGGLNGS